MCCLISEAISLIFINCACKYYDAKIPWYIGICDSTCVEHDFINIINILLTKWKSLFIKSLLRTVHRLEKIFYYIFLSSNFITTKCVNHLKKRWFPPVIFEMRYFLHLGGAFYCIRIIWLMLNLDAIFWK